MNTEEKDGQITTSYLVYRKGLTAETGGNWEEGGDPSAPCITLSYTDDKSGNPPGSGYDLQWAAYTGEAIAELEIRIDGEPVAVVPEQSESPILLVSIE